MLFRNRAFQVKMVDDKPKPMDDVLQPKITIAPEYAAELTKDVIITVGVVYVSARVATMACRVIESAARAYFR